MLELFYVAEKIKSLLMCRFEAVQYSRLPNAKNLSFLVLFKAIFLDSCLMFMSWAETKCIIIYNNKKILKLLNFTKPQAVVRGFVISNMLNTLSSLMFPDLAISVDSSSFNFLLVGLLFTPLLSLSISWHPQCRMKCQYLDSGRK